MKTSLLITQQTRHRSDCDKGSQSEQQGSRSTGSPPFRGFSSDSLGAQRSYLANWFRINKP